MNPEEENFKELKILEELGKNRDATQRHLAERVNVSLGMINWFLKKLAKKGLVKIKRLNQRIDPPSLTPSRLESGDTYTLRRTILLKHITGQR